MTAQGEILQGGDAGGTATVAWPPKVDVLGIGVTPTCYDEAAAVVLEAARQGASAVVSCHSVHALISSSRSADRAHQHLRDDHAGRPARSLVVEPSALRRSEGPGVWAGAHVAGLPRSGGGRHPHLPLRRAAGRHRAPPVAAVAMFPGLRIAGAETPPFTVLTPAEDEAVVARINASGARGVHRPRLPQTETSSPTNIATGSCAVQMCVGAAFDFHAGVKRMAPPWMQRRGLEWLYRLLSEPRRLGGGT